MEEEVRGRVRQRRSQATGLGQEKANPVLHLSTKSFSQVVHGWAAGGPSSSPPCLSLSLSLSLARALSRSRALSSCPPPVTLRLPYSYLARFLHPAPRPSPFAPCSPPVTLFLPYPSTPSPLCSAFLLLIPFVVCWCVCRACCVCGVCCSLVLSLQPPQGPVARSC